jgi:hypothetical protein
MVLKAPGCLLQRNWEHHLVLFDWWGPHLVTTVGLSFVQALCCEAIAGNYKFDP